MTIARDLLELDDEQFTAAIESVKRRMPTPPGARLQPYCRPFHDTVPTDHAPIAAHAASELHEEDKWKLGDGSGPYLWALATIIVVALASFVAWVTR